MTTRTHPANQTVGGAVSDRKKSFLPGIRADGPLDIPFDCSCSWVVRGDHWELKFADAKCPIRTHHRT